MSLDDVLTRLLMPIARLAMGHGLGLRDLSDPLKRAFLAVARQDAGPEATDSRLALATGLQRRDVVRLRGQMARTRPATLPARVLQAWPDAIVLPRTGPAPSFEALARATSQDVHPRTLLDLLRDAGAVAEDGADVRLLRRDYLPPAGSEAQLEWLSGNLHDHGMAAVGNVLGDAAFDRAAAFTGLTKVEADRLAALFETRQMDLLREIAAEAERAEGDGPIRVRFGGYGYQEDET